MQFRTITSIKLLSIRTLLGSSICLAYAISYLFFQPQTLMPAGFASNNLISDKSVNKQKESTISTLVDGIEQELTEKRLSKVSLAEIIEIVHNYPQISHAHIVLGNCCDALGLPEQAMEQYRLAFKYGTTKVEPFLELIKALVRAGQLTAASSLLKQATEKFPADPQILFWTGNALYKEGRYDEATALYEEALAKTEKPIIGLTSALGSLYMRQEQYTRALQLALFDLSYDKNLPEANEIAGLVYLRLRKYEKACPYLRVSFKNGDNSFSVAIGLTKSLIWCGNYEEAFLPALFALGNAHNLQEKRAAQSSLATVSPHLSRRLLKEHISQLARFPELEKNAYVHMELAKICLDKNLLDLALAEDFVTVKLNPQSAEAKYRLALILENDKHYYPAALQYLREAQVLEPYNREISQHLMRLEDRLTINKLDWAWQLKDWLNPASGF